MLPPFLLRWATDQAGPADYSEPWNSCDFLRSRRHLRRCRRPSTKRQPKKAAAATCQNPQSDFTETPLKHAESEPASARGSNPTVCYRHQLAVARRRSMVVLRPAESYSGRRSPLPVQGVFL